MTPQGVPFHPVVVIGLGKNLLFKSVLGQCVILPSLTRLTASGTGAICPFFRSSSPSITVEFRCNWPNSSEGGRPLLLDRPLFRTAATPEIPRNKRIKHVLIMDDNDMINWTLRYFNGNILKLGIQHHIFIFCVCCMYNFLHQ